MTCFRHCYTFAPMRSRKLNSGSYSRQLAFNQSGLRREKSEHGGVIRNSRKRRRPVGVRSSMHLVLKSSKARGKWRFNNYENDIEEILQKFARKNHIQLLTIATAGNHLHLHIKVRGRIYFRAFIRAISSAIMMKITGFSRWNPSPRGFQFWDQRPFSRIISTWSEFLNLNAYIEINQWEGLGFSKVVARYLHSGSGLASNSS